MFRLRKEHMEAFKKAVLEEFEDRMVVHLQESFPAACLAEPLGERGVRELIRYGIERAASYGIDVEADVSKYINLMFALDRDFDKNPSYPWAAEILNDPKTTDGEARVNRLCEIAEEFLR